ncbi:MAG: SpoIIE family protein phosphatase [Burkholderiales bacterium]|nr:SpoIIE family protein phosphatase [Phycisphaerae bacterium]
MEVPSPSFKLTDFMDVATLQEIQDSFAAVANVKATITDAGGNVLTQPNPTRDFVERQIAIARAEQEIPEAQKQGREYVAPIIVQGQKLGTIRMSIGAGAAIDDATAGKMSEKFQIDPKAVRQLARQLSGNPSARAAAVQFVTMIANTVARLCFQEYELRQRFNELTTIYNVTMMLAEPRDLKKLLERTVRAVCEVMDVKAASIRLIDEERDELVIKAVHNLSSQYLSKGPIKLGRNELHSVAWSPRGFEYVQNMTTDPRVQYPDEAAREGIVSMVSIAMRYRGRPIGVLRVYTAMERNFGQSEVDLLKAVAAQAAAAIENARLVEERLQSEAIERQIRMAAEVQQRMLPSGPPHVPGLDLAYTYVPCFDLAGDFFDFIELPDENFGVVVADVSGKGIPASLIMASVRASLRAQVDNVYYLYEVIRRLNISLFRDTKPTEFVTLVYGVIDARTRRFTYCNAGHPPAMLLRGGEITELQSDNMVLGIDPEQDYKQNFIDLHAGDTILLYTDGLPDAMNFEQNPYGKDRVLAAYKSAGGGSAQEIADHLLWDVRRFVGLSNRSDDLTMIVVRVT